MLKISFLEALNGDCILIKLMPSDAPYKNILIDGGVSATYNFRNSRGRTEDGALATLIDQLRLENQRIDLLVLTHIDDDHIDGILQWFKTDPDAHNMIGEVWFNSGRLIAEYLQEQENTALNHIINLPNDSTDTSVQQGVVFGQYIGEKGIWRREIIIQGKDIEWHNAKFQFLSPNIVNLQKLLKFWKKDDPGLNTSRTSDYHHSIEYLITHDSFEEDEREPNGSSIAFIMHFEGRRYLFLGDSHPSVIEEGLRQRQITTQNPISVELVKLSHHGSKGNTNKELLSLIHSNHYIISTNGNIHGHPDKQLLARLIKEKVGCQIYFNYPERSLKIFQPEDYAFLPFTINASKSEFVFSNGN
ncbi:Metal-dependent hydrolase, beta-lactamase superfamily II [Chitinophaga sp. YR627]|uniref:ComEC/Rec2 family competence protein n=1 Tax=Chitinophaga sp. YR627 TaxID=1881041 RepID=UPI0008EA1233|nr:MBL fold metallo-hydrolase [Chitinophaga sp. YR627]SFO75620.1 Metal-dependent hydrolase, beta-lactamase superfamily II [Chitinophaga sp. YR627]